MRIDFTLASPQARPRLGDGVFRISAGRGAGAADLFWARAGAPLPGWSQFARVPLGPEGSGSFRFTGGRAIPAEATQVLARAVRQDGESAAAPLPPPEDAPPSRGLLLTVLTDLHLTGKPWRLRQALRRAAESDGLLLLGDLVNDGLPGQFALLKRCIEEAAPELPILAVSGNHDYPPAPLPATGREDFPGLQDWLFDRLERRCMPCQRDRSGAYAVSWGDVEIIGLNAGSHWRELNFGGSAQLTWLEQHLAQGSGRWRVILCHAPPLAHNPQHKPGHAAYLSGDRDLQRVLDGGRNLIYLSGHTHLSCNSRMGCAQRCAGTVYANLSSLCPSVLCPPEPSAPEAWREPAVHRLRITPEEVELCTETLREGTRFARGYYRFPREGGPSPAQG